MTETDAPPAAPTTVPSARRELGAGLLMVVALAVLGVPLGVLWWAVSPSVAMKIGDGHTAYAVDFTTKAFIATDGRFVLVTGVAGIVCGVLVFLLARRFAFAAPLALAVGGLAAAVVAWQVGSSFGAGAFQHALATKPVGAVVHRNVELGAKGALVTWAVTALLAYLVGVAYLWAEHKPAPVTGPPQPPPPP